MSRQGMGADLSPHIDQICLDLCDEYRVNTPLDTHHIFLSRFIDCF